MLNLVYEMMMMGRAKNCFDWYEYIKLDVIICAYVKSETGSTSRVDAKHIEKVLSLTRYETLTPLIGYCIIAVLAVTLQESQKGSAPPFISHHISGCTYNMCSVTSA